MQERKQVLDIGRSGVDRWLGKLAWDLLKQIGQATIVLG